MNDRFFEHVVDDEYMAKVLGVEIVETPLECSADVLTEERLDELIRSMEIKKRMLEIF